MQTELGFGIPARRSPTALDIRAQIALNSALSSPKGYVAVEAQDVTREQTIGRDIPRWARRSRQHEASARGSSIAQFRRRTMMERAQGGARGDPEK